MQSRASIFNNPTLRTYLATGCFLGISIVLGFAGLAATRQLYVIGCIALGIMAWKDSPGRHFEVSIILFSFSPFVRRVIDGSAGYDPLGVMLSGPLLTVLVPCVELPKYVSKARSLDSTGPMMLALACITYGGLLSLVRGEFQAVIIQLLKWATPVLYAIWMLKQAANPGNNIIKHAARAFLIVTPIMGVYGVEQYVQPAPWDRLWMIYSEMGSVGSPEPFGVRVFSTMNSPGSFAVFATVGLLIFSFTRQGYQALMIGITVALALLLSQYRTAWIAMAIGLGYAWLYPRTRGRSTSIAVVAVLAGILAATAGGPIGDSISQRFDTFQNGADDGSAKERISTYSDLYSMVDQFAVGRGFSILSGDNSTGLVALDGTIVASYVTMGIFVGSVFLLSLVWGSLRAISSIASQDSPARIATGAVVLGFIVTSPLANITSGEAGFLFWAFVAIATGSPKEVKSHTRYSLRFNDTNTGMSSR